jgi:hypothetical protein
MSLAAGVASGQAEAREAKAPTAAQVAPVVPVAPIRLPPGTRWSPVEGRYLVGGGLAEATRAIEKQLARAGISFERLGPYRVRGVEVVRLLSQQPSTTWLALHLVRKEGRTFLDIVARPAPPSAPPSAPRSATVAAPAQAPPPQRTE